MWGRPPELELGSRASLSGQCGKPLGARTIFMGFGRSKARVGARLIQHYGEESRDVLVAQGETRSTSRRGR